MGGDADSLLPGPSTPWSFPQIYLSVVIGALVLMYLHMRYKKQEVRVDKPPQKSFVPRGFTAEELEKYDGVANELIFVGVKGIIYNVAREWYGPESAYHAFAGRESSRQLGKTLVGREECNADWTTLSAEHLQTLNDWEDRFVMKYVAVGWFVPDEGYEARGAAFPP